MSRSMRIKYVTMEPEESDPTWIELSFPDEMFEESKQVPGTILGPSIGQMETAVEKHLGRNDVAIVRAEFVKS
jgi:hypothetical protein